MELDENIKNDLKCSICSNYLTCTPIMVRPNGDSICGRCEAPQEERKRVVRNKAYEQIASAFTFQCRYKDDGCTFKSLIAGLEEHEIYCLYHKFDCPVLPSGSCNWIGSRHDLKTHFSNNHPDIFLTHPCNIKPNNIVRNFETNFLTVFCDELFLVQIKYNKSSAKFWHNVRLINDPKFTKNYKYNFEVLSERYNLATECDILEQEFFQMYDDPQKEIDFNSLLCLIGRFESLDFKITITEQENFVKCGDCNKNVLLKELKGKFCDICSKIEDMSKILSTSNTKCKQNAQGCMYDNCYVNNVRKHEIWFCGYTKNTCSLCQDEFGDLFSHYFQVHKGKINFELIKENNVTLDTKNSAVLILDDAIFICLWNLKKSHLEFKVISNLPKTDNSNYECILKMINPRSNYQKKYKLKHFDTVSYDWLALIKPDTNNPVIGVISEKIVSNAPQTFSSPIGLFDSYSGTLQNSTQNQVVVPQQTKTVIHFKCSFEIKIIKVK